jgi:hypothetical protein
MGGQGNSKNSPQTDSGWFGLDKTMQMILMLRKIFYFLFLSVTFLGCTKLQAQVEGYKDLWRTDVKLEELGKGGLYKTYDELMDYLLPRYPSFDANKTCYLVVRYLPFNRIPHQVNITFDANGSKSIYAFELPYELPLTPQTDAREAQELASKTRVSIWHVSPSKEMEGFISRHLRQGIPITLNPPEIVLHGDMYEVSGSCQSTFKTVFNAPRNSSTQETEWLNRLWKFVELSAHQAGGPS